MDDILQIDMAEEPEDDDDLIFLATNQWTGSKYEFVTNTSQIDVESIATAAKSLVSIGQQISNMLNTTFAPVLQALQEVDEQQAREARLHGLEHLAIQTYDSDARLCTGGVRYE